MCLWNILFKIVLSLMFFLLFRDYYACAQGRG